MLRTIRSKILKKTLLPLCLILLFGHSLRLSHAQEVPILIPSQLNAIGQKIYHNETGSKPKHLVAWNDGESFASLGIGHFIWFPENLESPFTETFPELIRYLQSNKVAIPEWLANQHDCPWANKAEFMSAKGQEQMRELQQLMIDTFEHQVSFIYQRMQRALPLILDQLNDTNNRALIESRFHQLASNEIGMYSLIDYVNFKGEGVSALERYAGEGWGLLQVLQEMNTEEVSVNLAFSIACDQVLTRRVANSPQRDIEQKWLAGWRKRCSTYSIGHST